MMLHEIKRNYFSWQAGSVATLILAVLSGCGGIHKPFELTNKEYQVKPGTLAIISGSESEVDVRLATALTQELKTRSSFRVMNQDEIARRVPNYPQEIMKEANITGEKPDYSRIAPPNKNRVDALHARLKTDYVFVVWGKNLQKWVTTSSQGGTRFDYYVDVYSRFVEYPGGKVAGYSIFTASKSKFCFLFSSEGDAINDMLASAAREIADDFIKRTNSKKTGN